MAILERVAVHQTRLRVPGVGLDARGVVLGSRGLVLLPSLDRLVAFLSVYSSEQALDSLVESLRIEVVRSKLGTRELSLSFEAGSSDRMDRIADVARLTGGFCFTGTSRHYVQYRDASAPFGFDAVEITATDAPLSLYHSTFSQVYDSDRQIELKELLLRLAPAYDPFADLRTRNLWLVCEPGLGPSMLHYLTRSRVQAEAGIVEWPPESSFDDAPVQRWLFRVEGLPARIRPMLGSTPGVGVFLPESAGAAVEQGYRHPIALRACPVFDPEGLTLFRGEGKPPLCIDKLPVLAPIASLSRANLRTDEARVIAGTPADTGPSVRVPIRLTPGIAANSSVAATLVTPEELPLLRRLVYALGPRALRETRIAVTHVGAFLLREAGVEALPVGLFFRQVHPVVFVPSGLQVVPAVEPDVLFATLGSPRGYHVFLRSSEQALAVKSDAFAPLERALLEAERWAPIEAASFDSALTRELPVVWLESLGARPLKDAEPLP